MFVGSPVFAQDYNIKQFTTDDGCPNTLAVSLQEDSLGNLWLGFFNKGVFKYNGYQFENIEFEAYKGGLVEVFRNKDKEILIGTTQGIYVYRNSKFELYYGISEHVRTYFYKDENEYFGTEIGDFLIYKKGKLEQQINVSIDLIGQIDIDFEERIWFNGGKNKASFYKNGKIENFDFEGEEEEKIWSVCVTAQNEVLVSSLKTIKVFKNNKLEIWQESSKLAKPSANYIYKDSRNRIWFLHLNEISIYDKGKVTIIPENNFKGLALTSVYEDNDGVFWLTTTKGLLKLQNEFCILNPFSLTAEFLLRNIFVDSKDRVWTGSTMDGLQFWKDGKTIKLDFPDLENTTFYGFYEDNLGKIWIASSKGIFIYNKQKLQFLKRGIEIPDLPVYSITIDKNNFIWGSTPLGIFKLKNKKHTFYHSTEMYSDEKAKAGVFSVFADFKGNIWALSDFGLLQEKEGRFLKVNLGDSIETQKMWGMVQTPDSALWIASERNGLLRLEIPSKKIKYFNVNNGLLSNELASISVDNTGNVVVGSFYGINKISFTKSDTLARIISYTKEHGLIDEECMIKVLACDKKGGIWFGTHSGLLRFQETVIETSTNDIPSFINEQFQYEKQNLILYKNNDLSFEFSAIYLSNSSSLRYSYRLLGLSNNWTEFSNKRFAQFSNLPSGDYILELRSKTTINQDRTGFASLSFSIKKPIWLEYWFIALFVFLLLLTIYFSLKLWSKRISNKFEKKEAKKRKKEEQERKKEEQKRKIIELELKFLRSQMNPHFLFNSINSIQNLIISNKIDKALNYLNDFSRLIRRVLNYSEKETVTIKEEVDFLNEYLSLEKLRFKEKINVELIISEEIDPAFDRMPPMLIQPVVENAIKHGLLPMEGNGKLEINFDVNNEILHVKIKDNGVGRKYHQEKLKGNNHLSKGTQIIESRMNMLQKSSKQSDSYEVEIIDLENEHNKPSGTLVIIKVKLY